MQTCVVVRALKDAERRYTADGVRRKVVANDHAPCSKFDFVHAALRVVIVASGDTFLRDFRFLFFGFPTTQNPGVSKEHRTLTIQRRWACNADILATTRTSTQLIIPAQSRWLRRLHFVRRFSVMECHHPSMRDCGCSF